MKVLLNAKRWRIIYSPFYPNWGITKHEEDVAWELSLGSLKFQIWESEE